MLYPNTIKAQAVARKVNGEPVNTICEELGISRTSLYRWGKDPATRICGETDHEMTVRNFNIMRNKLDRQLQIIEVLKTVKCTVHAPLKEWLAELESLYGQYSVHVLCEALDVDRGTFYNHIKRNKRDKAWFEKRRDKYCELVTEIYRQNNQVFGAEKITAILVQQGHQVSLKYVSRIMNECGLSSIRNTAKRDYIKELKTSQKKNILQQQFQASHPNQTWVSDVTCFKVNNSYLYICTIIDLYSRRIVGYKTSLRNSTQLITATFRAAFIERNAKAGLVFHSDRGANYTSNTFQQLLKRLGVRQSFSLPGRPHDNAVAEAFFATLKRECLYRYTLHSVKEVKGKLAEYIDFYNTKRPHKTLNHRTPCKMEELYYSSGRL